ncbi:YrhB domain-containing protein [Streptomyces sp. NPDC054796]
MLSHEDALAEARAFLGRTMADGQYTIVLQPELTKEHAVAWAIRFDSQEHLDTGDMTRAPFTRVVIVPKDGAEPPYFPPSHLSVAELNERLAGPAGSAGPAPAASGA